MHGPDPADPFPMPGFPQVCYLRNVIDAPNIEIGEYTYYDDPDGADNFLRNVLYHFDFIGDRLRIGRFCAIARGVRFVMNGANHRLDGISTYPFQIFGGGWERVMPKPGELPFKGDTVIGNDVWIGYDALIMPGVCIGDGAIIAARSVVTHDVPPYTLVGGNPARPIRRRFGDADIDTLLRIAWWDWPVERITRLLPLIVAGDVAALARMAAPTA